MKIFGSRHGGARSKHAGDAKKKPCFWRTIPVGQKILIITLSVLLAFVLVLVYFVKFYIKPPEPVAPPVSNITDPVEPGNEETTEPETDPKAGFYNVLLAGTDYDGLRTDTIMIARIDTANHSVALMSIPRDTLIQTSRGPGKINSVYGVYGCGTRGMEALVDEVEELLGIRPSGYILVNLDAFVELVDAIDGVYFDVPQNMYHNDPTQDLFINLKAGYQLLDGEKAMQLVRFRGYLMGDIQRTQVQQQFLVAVAKQCVSKITKISDYIDIFSRNVTTDLTTGNLLYFAQELLKSDLYNMNSYTLPGESVYIDNVDYYDLYDNRVAEIVKQDFYPYTTE